MFLNSDIDFRHFCLEGDFSRGESSDQLNQRYLRGAMKTGCRAITIPRSASLTAGRHFCGVCARYVCPDLGSRFIAHMGFRDNVQRGSMLGLGCAGALPTLQRAADFVRANPARVALMVAVEICSACYYVDNTLETVVGNAICADGAAAFLLARDSSPDRRYPETVDFETFLDPGQIEEVGLRHQNGKLRIILGASIHKIVGPMIEKALERLPPRHGLSRPDIRSGIASRRTEGDRRSTAVASGSHRSAGCDSHGTSLRNYGNMSSPTVMFVLDEVVRKGDPHPGDMGIMVGLGPGMAAELALLRW